MSEDIFCIMPVFNGEKNISSAINSVLHQTILNWNLIIVDDHSFDRTVEVVEKFFDERIILIKNESNVGPGLSRNKGLAWVKSRYNCGIVCFLDHDDTLYPHAFKCFQSLLSTKFDLGCFPYNIRSNQFLKTFYPSDISLFNIFTRCPFSCLASCVKLEVIIRNKISFRHAPREDLLFWFDLFKATESNKLKVGNIPIGVYNLLKSSRSANKTRMILEQYVTITKYCNQNRLMALLFILAYCIFGLLKYRNLIRSKSL